jgi:hypothetical protein
MRLWERSGELNPSRTGRPLDRVPSVLGLARILSLRRFPTTHDVVKDWYNHANYFTLFLIGAGLARQPGVCLQLVQMGPVIESVVLIVLTITASFGIFELVRRVPVLRACFGIKSLQCTNLQQTRLAAS